MILEELRRLFTWRERHRRLFSRLLLVIFLTAVVDAVGTVLIYIFERHVKQGDIHSVFDALFFTTVQLLTVSSQISNPFTVAGRIVDVFLEIWAVLVVAGSAGAIASFFQTGDSGERRRADQSPS
jgi:drug/metabolite transporter (DMT)-like permease